MDIQTARKLIAYAFRQKKDIGDLTVQDFIRELAHKAGFMSEAEVRRFVEESTNERLLTEEDGHYKPTFSTGGIVIPLDFSVKTSDLFATKRDAPLSERMIEAAIASGLLSRNDLLEKSRELQSELRYIDFEVAMAAILNEYCIDVSEFLKEMS
ncbi:MAG: DUF2240 family protein [Candidatus Thermoplasmatota archaeon]|nr:DUF2240 family protein [Candidatus Thermoplasmatota archaeon]MCL5730816.1 DUF2240 family protein [Candidatus Thermoplasmatota archaeon]